MKWPTTSESAKHEWGRPPMNSDEMVAALKGLRVRAWKHPNQLHENA